MSRLEKTGGPGREQLYSAIENMPFAVFMVDHENRLAFYNRSTLQYCPHEKAPAEGDRLENALLPALVEKLSGLLDKFEPTGEPISREIRFEDHMNGLYLSATLLGAPGADKRPLTAVLLRDITRLKEYQARLLHRAAHDYLTKLFNREMFLEILDGRIEHAREQGRTVSLFFMDLDNFKRVNDTWGHWVGDDLLIAVADRLRSISVPENTVVARLGGDEFVMLVEEPPGESKRTEIAESILGEFDLPFSLGGKEIFSSISIGIACCPEHSDNRDDLMKHADIALYTGKESGRGCYRVFDLELQQTTGRKAWLEQNILRAVDQGEIYAEYQPVINIETGDITAFEALCRWKHPQQGQISPAEFIPAAEVTAVIEPLSRYMFESGFEMVSEWQKKTGRQFDLHVNFSAVLFSFPEILALIVHLAKSHPDVKLVVELTEDVLLEDSRFTGRVLQRFAEEGIRISMDDFGSGYSGMRYLLQHNFDSVKVDKTIIQGVDESRRHLALLSGLVSVTAQLDLPLICEGVEDAQTARRLLNSGVNLVQGFFYARPMPADGVVDFINGFTLPAI